MPPKHQFFCFTHNNYAEQDILFYRNLYSKGFVTWIIWGKETAPSTGTPHLQGALWTSQPKRLADMKRKINGAWIAVPGLDKGPQHWNDYCSKQDAGMEALGIEPPFEDFKAQVPKGQGTRCDLLEVKRKIDNGTTINKLKDEDEHFKAFASHAKYFTEYAAHKRRRKEYTKPTVIVYYGPTGTNKTRRVYEEIPDIDDFFRWDPNMDKWFDGYTGHDYVLFDEFRGQLSIGQMLALLDGYPGTRVQFKGGTALWSPTHIYLTSPKHPRDWYPSLSSTDKIDQLLRRIDDIVCTGTPEDEEAGPSQFSD